MNTIQILTLCLAVSCVVNVALGAGITARKGGASMAQAILTGASAAGITLTIFLAAISAYR
jgi:hypothetical protein